MLLHAVLLVMCDVAVLQTYMYASCNYCCYSSVVGMHVEINPGPVQKVCPNCNINIDIKKKLCECGYVFYKNMVQKQVAPIMQEFSVSSGCPQLVSNVNAELDVQREQASSNVNIDLEVQRGWPSSNLRVDLVQRGRPYSNVIVNLDVQREHTTSSVDSDLDPDREHDQVS